MVYSEVMFDGLIYKANITVILRIFILSARLLVRLWKISVCIILVGQGNVSISGKPSSVLSLGRSWRSNYRLGCAWNRSDRHAVYYSGNSPRLCYHYSGNNPNYHYSCNTPNLCNLTPNAFACFKLIISFAESTCGSKFE